MNFETSFLSDYKNYKSLKPLEYNLTVKDNKINLYNLVKVNRQKFRNLTDKTFIKKVILPQFRLLINNLENLTPQLNNLYFTNKQNISNINNLNNLKIDFNYKSQFLRITLIKLLATFINEPKEKNKINKSGLHLMDNLEFLSQYKKLFNILIMLNAPDIILWFFFQVPNWCNYNIDGYREVYNKMLDYAIENWPEHLKFNYIVNENNRDFELNNKYYKYIYELASGGSTYYYNLCYHYNVNVNVNVNVNENENENDNDNENENDNEHNQENNIKLYSVSNVKLITKFNRLLDIIVPNINLFSKIWKGQIQEQRQEKRNLLFQIKYKSNILDLFDIYKTNKTKFSNLVGNEYLLEDSNEYKKILKERITYKRDNNMLEQVNYKLSQKKIFRKIKICFISENLESYTSVFKDRIGIINGLSNIFFDVYVGLFTTKNKLNSNKLLVNFLGKFINSNKIIYLSKFNYGSVNSSNILNIQKNYMTNNNIINKNQTVLESYNFDIIFYCDIGMNQTHTLLAHSRCAPIQMTTWGHSETSGLDTIDYFISSKYFEDTSNIDNIKNNYSEKVILLNDLGTFYYPPRKILNKILLPNFENLFKKRVQFGIAEDSKVIGCLQSYYKFNPEFEKVLAQIIVLCKYKYFNNYNILLSNSLKFNKLHLNRFYESINHEINKFNSQPLEYLYKDIKYFSKEKYNSMLINNEEINKIDYKININWFEEKNPAEWLNLVSICDVMLDPFPFGGCNTSLEAFDYNIPVITLPSNKINGRFTYGFYKRMIENCNELEKNSINKVIANNIIDYQNKLFDLLDYPINMFNMKEFIKNNKNKLFQNINNILEYEKMVMLLIKNN
jgi:hypothetical protein